jgi:hypothetical protein
MSVSSGFFSVASEKMPQQLLCKRILIRHLSGNLQFDFL